MVASDGTTMPFAMTTADTPAPPPRAPTPPPPPTRAPAPRSPIASPPPPPPVPPRPRLRPARTRRVDHGLQGARQGRQLSNGSLTALLQLFKGRVKAGGQLTPITAAERTSFSRGLRDDGETLTPPPGKTRTPPPPPPPRAPAPPSPPATPPPPPPDPPPPPPSTSALPTDPPGRLPTLRPTTNVGRPARRPPGRRQKQNPHLTALCRPSQRLSFPSWPPRRTSS
jgi:hypothetical protein